MAKLARNASGSRHLRWAREILATLAAHREINDLLTDAQRSLLATEEASLGALVDALAAAVAPYRDHVEHAHVGIRAKQRVANYLCDEAQLRTDGQMRPHRKTIEQALKDGFARIFSRKPLSRVLRAGHDLTVQYAVDAAAVLRALPASVPATAPLADRLELVAKKLKDLVTERADVVDAQRLPLKMAVEKAIFGMREGLDKMDARLREHFTVEFIESLYPELSRGNTALADEHDEEDDDTATPDAPPATPG